jgi:putative ATP-dependent endonuclease of OLD family
LLNTPPSIYIEAVISQLTTEDEDVFADCLVPWDAQKAQVLENSDDGKDPFEGREKAIRVFFEGWFSQQEDDFEYHTKFLRQNVDPHEDCPDFNRRQKRHIGFLIYRDFRGLTRPITLEPTTLFGRLLLSQNVVPKNFEKVFSDISNVLSPVVQEQDFISLLNAYKAEIERFMPLTQDETSSLSFDLTDRTRSVVKEEAQLYTKDNVYLPIQKSGAGTRSLAILSMLTLIMRRRGRGILALEEPETFLFPHAQRRLIDECLSLADQLFVTTHSPFVLERLPVDGVGRVTRSPVGAVCWTPLKTENVKQINLYSKRLKSVHAEALMGRCVVLVEGDSDRWWLLGASRAMNRLKFENRFQEAFELQGIAVVSAESNGDIIKLGTFFSDAGLVTVGLFDQIDDLGLLETIYMANIPSIFLWGRGLEEILSKELPVAILKKLLTEAPHSRQALSNQADISTLSEIELRERAFNKLIAEKGSGSMHEWLISQLDIADFPITLKRLVDRISLHCSGEDRLMTQSLCR